MQQRHGQTSGRIRASVQRRAARRRQSKPIDYTLVIRPWMVGVASLVVVGIVWVSVATLFGRLESSSTSSTGSAIWLDESVTSLRTLSLQDVLSHQQLLVDLWPDDETNPQLGESLTTCLPDGTDRPCRTRQNPNDPGPQTIGILRPPGLLGFVMEDFVKMQLNQSSVVVIDGREIPSDVVMGTSHINLSQHPFDKIIRTATLPILLEAIDLALSTITEEYSVDGKRYVWLSIQDVLGVVRLLVQWQCRLSSLTSHTALLTVSLRSTFAHPSVVGDEVKKFVNLGKYTEMEQADLEHQQRVEEKKHPHIKGSEPLVDGLAGQIVQRIDTCTAVAAQLSAQTPPRTSLAAMVDHVVKDEMQQSDDCQSSSRSMMKTASVPETKVMEIVRHLLSPNPQDSVTICQLHPNIPICQ